MKIVAEYDFQDHDIDLSYWNAPDILDSFDREDEPFESVDDLMQTIAEGIDNGDIDFDDMIDQLPSYVVTWTVQE